jgi:2'-5' RNA ligase
MRLFVAVWPDTATRRALGALALVPVPGLRVVRPEQWHVTLRFLGEVAPALVPPLLSSLRDPAAAADPPVIARVGPATAWFGRAAVLQVPVAGLDGLATGVRAATSELVAVGEREEPTFTGHLTLARRARRRLPDAAQRAALAGIEVAGSFPVRGLDLVVSEPAAGGHRYRSLGTVPLGRR